MNLNNLVAPIIVYWDLNPLLHINPNIIQRICDDLISNKVFILNMWNPSPAFSNECSMILKKLRDEDIDINLTISYSALIISDLKNFMPALKKILIHTESVDQIASLPKKIQPEKPEKLSVGISYAITETTYKNIPDILKSCLEAGINNVFFPIQRPSKDQKIFWLDSGKNYWLSEKIKHLKTDGLNLIIHDPFLWKTFNRESRQNNKGCQGGNTMVYISESLDVTPCPLLPVLLGNLLSENLTEIFSSNKRQQIRKSLSMPPQECENCDKLNECGGGCRGRTYILYKTLDKRDPACLDS
jgi:GeoRSP system SPASM domain protein